MCRLPSDAAAPTHAGHATSRGLPGGATIGYRSIPMETPAVGKAMQQSREGPTRAPVRVVRVRMTSPGPAELAAAFRKLFDLMRLDDDILRPLKKPARSVSLKTSSRKLPIADHKGYPSTN